MRRRCSQPWPLQWIAVGGGRARAPLTQPAARVSPLPAGVQACAHGRGAHKAERSLA